MVVLSLKCALFRDHLAYLKLVNTYLKRAVKIRGIYSGKETKNVFVSHLFFHPLFQPPEKNIGVTKQEDKTNHPSQKMASEMNYY